MEQKPDDNSRRALFERFRAFIESGDASASSDSAFFDLDELIDIYDYAADVHNEFIKMEVLFYGASVFPKSDELKTRRSFLYYELGEDAAVSTTLRNAANPSSTLNRLIALRKHSDIGRNTWQQLSRILNDTKRLSDEEVIQLVAHATSDANYKWLMDNVEALRAKTEYLPTLYYELAGVAEDNGDLPTAVRMAEELTMLEPFNPEFWERLAEEHLVGNDPAEALAAIEYALAINPEGSHSRVIKANCLFMLERNTDEAIDLYLSELDDERFDANALQRLAMLLSSKGRDSEAIAAIESFLKRNPADFIALDTIFILDPESVSQRLRLLEQHLADYSNSPDFWCDWALRHMSARRYLIAVQILMCALSLKIESNQLMAILAEALYRAGRYAELVSLTSDAESPEIAIAFVMSLIRLGRNDEARLFIERYLRHFDQPDNPVQPLPETVHSPISNFFYSIGVQVVMRNILAAMSLSPSVPIDDFDPFLPK